MTRKMKRTLSLILALVMLCSTLGVMAFAQTRANVISCSCGICKPYCQWNEFLFIRNEKTLNRVTECPVHLNHDAEEYYIYDVLKCTKCNHYTYHLLRIEYECI